MFGQGLNFGGLTGSAGFDAYYLVVAGGASGATWHGGGGGAGGYRTSYGTVSPITLSGGSMESSLTLTKATNYTVTVGGGGAGVGTVGPNLIGNAGSNSVFSSITSTGGGYGSSVGTAGPGSGGSGGGANQGSGGSAVTSPVIQGHAGGNGIGSASCYTPGGGGGAGSVGVNANGCTAGDGGDGLENSITGSATFYAGGGGGGVYTGGTPGTGGSGVGGNGGPNSYSTNGFPGATNTGSGGGGANATLPQTTGAGGSGTVILRYPTAKVSSYAVTGTLNTVINGNYPIANKACYTLNGNVLDISGNGYNGTNYNVNFSTGRYGQAGSFNGSSSYVDTGISGTTVAWGYSAWFKTSVASGCVFAQLNGSGSSSGVDIIVQSGGQLRCLFHQNGNSISSNYLFGSGLNDGNWHHVAYTWDGVNGNNATITIDGRTHNQTAQISGGTNADATLKIGRLGSSSGGGYFNGLLNQVRVFSSKLSASQISSLYNEGYVRETTNSNDSILQFTGGSGDITFS